MTEQEHFEQLMFAYSVASNEILRYIKDHIIKNMGVEKNNPSKKNQPLEKKSTFREKIEVEQIRQEWMDDVVGLASEFFINEDSFNEKNLSELMINTSCALDALLRLKTPVDQTLQMETVRSDTDSVEIHGKITFREKLKQDHPECVDPERLGGCMGCPFTYGYEKEMPELCHDLKHFNCEECWNREYKYSDTDSVNQTEKTPTCREKVEQEHPEAVGKNFCGGVCLCPHDFGYSETRYCSFKCNKYADDEEVCTACWNQPVQPKSV